MMAPRSSKAERRRRNSNGLLGYRDRLAVDESLLDREKYAYRWINDEAGRIHQMTVQDDWEIVSDRDNATGTGSELAEQVGSGEKGSPLRAVLVRKPKDYFDEDKREQQRRIDEQEKALTSNVAPGTDSTNLYQPDVKTSISRG